MDLKRDSNLELLRILAMLGIVASHYIGYIRTELEATYSPLFDFLLIQANWGKIGINCFMLIWYRIDSVIPSGSLAMKINHLPFFSEMTAFMGIGFVVLLFASIKAPKWLGIIGKMTLGIYAVHQSLLWIYQMLLYKYPYIKTLLGNFWADTIIGFVVLFSLSVIVYRTLAIWSFSNKYLLGKS